MTTIEEKSQVISILSLARRIKRELENIKKLEIFCDDSDVTITKYSDKDFYIFLKNRKDNRLYKFIIPTNYPFSPPGLEINNKPYLYYLRFNSNKFRDTFYKYKGPKCLCCETLLCSNNWSPQYTLINIMDEVSEFHNECHEIVVRLIVDVIKRKYLHRDINILEWIY
jgi:ubiquitin-protein ligase